MARAREPRPPPASRWRPPFVLIRATETPSTFPLTPPNPLVPLPSPTELIPLLCSGTLALLGVKAEPAAETPLGRRTRSAVIVINEGGRRAYSSAPPPCFVKPKTEPGLAPVKKEPAAPVTTELDDDDAALEWARRDFIAMEKERLEKAKERQRAALLRFAERRRGRDEGGVVVICDSDGDDDNAPPPVRHGDAEQGSSRGARVKEEKADNDDGGDGGDFSQFFL